MKKDCLSEEIFEVISNEESHYKRRSFDKKARGIPPAFARFDLASRMTKTLYFAELFHSRDKVIFCLHYVKFYLLYVNYYKPY